MSLNKYTQFTIFHIIANRASRTALISKNINLLENEILDFLVPILQDDFGSDFVSKHNTRNTFHTFGSLGKCCNIDSKFGISVHQLPLVRKIVDGFDVPLDGIHMHSGSDILDVQVFLSAADILFNVARSFPEIKYLNERRQALGGFLPSRRKKTKPLDIPDLSLFRGDFGLSEGIRIAVTVSRRMMVEVMPALSDFCRGVQDDF